MLKVSHSMLNVAKYFFSLCETSHCNDRADIYNIQYWWVYTIQSCVVQDKFKPDKLIHTKLLFVTWGSTAEQCTQKDNHENDYISSFYFRWLLR